MKSDEKNEKTEAESFNFDINILYEIFSVLYTEGLWQLLSPEAQELGKKVYKTVNDEELPPIIGTMKYTAEQHMNFIAQVVPTSAQQSEFWKLVTEIAWFVILIEKNPLIAQRLMESEESKEEILKSLSQGKVL